MTLRSRRSSVPNFICALLAVALFATACGGGSDATAEGDGSSETTETNTTETTPDEPADSGDGDTAETETEAIEEEPEELAIAEDNAEVAVRGGTMRYGMEADVDQLDPTAGALSSPGLLMGGHVFDTLTAYSIDDLAVPFLAETMTPNDDFSVWTMTLRSGISFHDGTPLNADAVVTNFEAQRSHPLVGLAVKPYFPDEEAAVAIDELTVQYNLIGPDAWFPASLTGQLGMVASPTWLAALADDPILAQEPVGTGPFSFDSRSQDSVTRLVRNDDYWAGEVFLDAIEFSPVTDPDIRADLLLEGELNALQSDVPETNGYLRDEDGINNVLDDTGEERLIMLNSSRKPFDDIRAREALTLATPHDNFAQLIGAGVSRPANQMFTPESIFFDPSISQVTDSPDDATPLVESYCGDFPDNCTDGKIDMELQWSGPSVVQTRIADLLVEGWTDHFNVERQELLQDVHIQETAFGLYDVVTWRQFGAPDPSRDRVWVECDTIAALALNWTRLCDESRDELIETMAAEPDQAARVETIQAMSRNVNEAFTHIFTIHTLWNNAFDESVAGVCGRQTPEGIELRCSLNGRTWSNSAWIAN